MKRGEKRKEQCELLIRVFHAPGSGDALCATSPLLVLIAGKKNGKKFVCRTMNDDQMNGEEEKLDAPEGWHVIDRKKTNKYHKPKAHNLIKTFL